MDGCIDGFMSGWINIWMDGQISTLSIIDSLQLKQLFCGYGIEILMIYDDMDDGQ